MNAQEFFVGLAIFAIAAPAYLAGIALGWRWRGEEAEGPYECGYRDGWAECCDVHGVPNRSPLRVIPGGKDDAA